ncbi:MAG: XdhC family protein [Acidobacteria bacterium]|uniref:XdhC family protein n=1 Tax=Candidatus Polarisedimenticola svalbardensis TaxID=2886004 RepID=A0A8J6Y1N8_9BACT|nr:XdhC family protein [Candidatus Polarisedimenticola svalbardensis]
MRDILDHIRDWRKQGRKIAVATLVQVWGSAPRRPGARVVVSDATELAGSVSGGCVESAVLQEAVEVFHTGRALTLEYGVTDEDAWAVGLTCGGAIELLVEEIPGEGDDPVWDTVLDRVESEALFGMATVLAGDRAGARLVVSPDGARAGSLGESGLDDGAAAFLSERFPNQGAWRHQVPGHDCELFLEILGPRDKLVIFGGVHIAIPLVRMARDLGWHTTVVDPRTAFVTRERFPDADRLLTDWPDKGLANLGVDAGTAVAVLSHDPKIDLPAVREGLASPAFYVGALGSRKTHKKRVDALEGAGVSREEIARIHAPIGLDLGGREPQEIALAILAEIVAVRCKN